MQMLVLDEADRILDMGFREQLLRILDYLPKVERQTLLFSATQSRDVASLAKLSLRNPEYLGVHDKDPTATPKNLKQSLIVVPLEHKLSAVFSFIRTHLQSKSIIFFDTCAQVRHAYELFCALRPGIPITCVVVPRRPKNFSSPSPLALPCALQSRQNCFANDRGVFSCFKGFLVAWVRKS